MMWSLLMFEIAMINMAAIVILYNLSRFDKATISIFGPNNEIIPSKTTFYPNQRWASSKTHWSVMLIQSIE